MLVEKQRGALRLAACDGAARSAGLRPGMALAEARAIVPAIEVTDIDRAADAAALMRLAQFCERFTPLLALDGDDGLLLDITGCASLFGGETKMVDHIARRLTRKNLTLRHALAGTPDCAHVLTRFGAATQVRPGDEASIVASLPVAALETKQETITALIRAGLKTIGDLARRPTQLLTARFGAALTTKLQRVLGQEDTRLTPLRAPPELLTEKLFAEPLLHMDHIMVALSTLLTEICTRLEKRGLGGRKFEASFFRTDGQIRRVQIDVAQPMRDPAALGKLFALRLETLSDPLDPGFGFDALRLGVERCDGVEVTQVHLLNTPTISNTSPFPHRGKVARSDGRGPSNKHEFQSLDSESAERPPSAFQAPSPYGGRVTDDLDERLCAEAQLLTRLAIRFDQANVLRFIARDSHDPARAAALVPTAAQVISSGFAEDSLPRPLQFFVPAQLIEVMAEVPDGPPIRFRWRKVLHQVRAAEGPERIEGEWWRDGAKPPRDYYRVEDESGARFWVYREGLFTDVNPKWFMQGLFG